MDKQEQIEEMEKDIAIRIDMAKGVAGSMNNGVEGWLSEYLYNAGYRKIDENAVVLTEEEYERWQGQTLNIKKVRKETAEKFAEKVEQAIVDNTYPYFDKDGKPVNIWKATTGFDKIDEIVKEFTGNKQ